MLNPFTPSDRSAGFSGGWAASPRIPAAFALPILLLAAGCLPGGGAVDPAAASGKAAAVPVAVAPVVLGGIAAHYTATTTLEAEKQAQVLARVSGLIQSIEAEEGDMVPGGQPLLRIENGEYRFRLDQAEAKTRNLQAKFDRVQAMSQELVSQEEIETARNDLATSKAEQELARLTLSYTTVIAPFEGQVVRRLVDVGQNVAVGAPLFAIADLHPLLARIHVPAKELRRIQVDQAVSLVLDSNGLRLQGKIKLVSPAIDPTTGTIKVTVEVADYPPGTRPGDFVEARIVTERRESTPIVPRLAVVTEKEEQVVYVARGGEVDRRTVEVGFSDDLHTEIRSGVKAGEQVVVKGQRSLKHGMQVTVLEDVAAKEAAGGSASPQSPPADGAGS